MPRVVSYTPSWLSHPAPGARIFSDPEKPSPASPTKTKASTTETMATPSKPRRTIAYRGTEVFTVVGNKIRWADLETVQDRWETKAARSSDQEPVEKVYRTLTTSIYYEITNLVISPSGHFLAVCTQHSIYVAALPASSRLREVDHSDIKLKTVQLARLTHTIDAAPLASVLWHPYAASSVKNDCLVTISTDAVVRTWEFTRSDSTSFDQPTLALSIRQLSNARTTSDNVHPRELGANRGFSADVLDFQVASACFGGRGIDNEDPWAPMTLWIVMTNTDVYAICPLLPEIWRPIPTTIPSLTTSAVAQISNMSADDMTQDEKIAAKQRYEWAQELDDLAGEMPESPAQEPARQRPTAPSAIPRLQGPFELDSGTVDDDDDVVDIFVIPANLDEEDLFGDDDSDILTGAKSLPFSVLCLTTSSNQLHVLLELDGVVGQWLPRKQDDQFKTPGAAPGQYVLLETLSLDTTSAFPIITPSSDPYNFYITSNTSIYAVTLQDWANKIGQEVIDDTPNGMSGRLTLACSGAICTKSQILSQQSDSILSTAIVVDTPTLGTLVLSTLDGRAVAAQLDHRTEPIPADTLMHFIEPKEIDTLPTRAPYAPSSIFYADHQTSLDTIKSHIPASRRGVLTQDMRLSPATLDIMTFAHRTFSQQTSAIEKATNELFRRCVRLRDELADQVKSMSELEGRLRILLEDEDGNEIEPNARFEERVSAAQARQKDLVARYEKVRRRVAAAGPKNKPLSKLESAWVEEVAGFEKTLDEEGKRVKAAKELSAGVQEQLKRVEKKEKPEKGRGGYMSRFQREKIKEVGEMVEREGAIIQAVEGRLARLAM